MKESKCRSVLLVMFVSLLIVSIFGFVSSESLASRISSSSGSMSDYLPTGLQSAYTDWQNSTLGTESLRLLFGVLIALLIYSVLTTSGFIESKGVVWIMSGIIAIISVAFISDAAFTGIGESYAAFGLTMTVFLPFLILLFFTFSAAKKADPTARVLQMIIWVLFAGFLIIRLFFADIPAEATWYIVIPALGAIGMIIFNTMIYRGLMKLYISAYAEGSEDKLKKAIAMEKLQAEGLENLAGSRRSV